MSGGIDQARIVSDLEARWLAGLNGAARTEGRRILDQLVADWAREASSHSEPAEVTEVQQKDLQQVLGQADPAERLTVLRGELMKRQVRRLRARTFELGTAILEGRAERAEAKQAGEPLLKEAEGLAEGLKALPDTAERQRLQRELGEALMEALFAVEGGAMSPRLSRQSSERSGPPGIRPA